MKKNVAVIFTANNARILVNPVHPPEGALMNPDLTAVRGVAPHYWKLSRGKIVEMSVPEKVVRDAHIELHGADNSHEPAPRTHRQRVQLPALIWGAFAVGLLLGVFIG